VKKFVHINAHSIDEAVAALKRYNERARLIAGGTDLLGKMKDMILPNYPEALINIKTIPDLDFIREENGLLKIGALTRLADIAAHELIKDRYSALATAAGRTASPHLREMGTLAGNICQDIRCWYYRSPDNRFPCLRKGGGRCYAINGDNRYHSIYGGSVDQGCYAVHPSDTAPALIALASKIRTSKRTIKAEDFFQVSVAGTTVLDHDEIVLEIMVPVPGKNTKSAFTKFALRKSIDFPIVNCAISIVSKDKKIEQARICLNAVFVKPYRPFKAEEAIIGEPLETKTAELAGNKAVAEVQPLSHNGYMVQVARTLVTRTLSACF
jgi:xanthine dehydrogenase YagS FAD-binding subunit